MPRIGGVEEFVHLDDEIAVLGAILRLGAAGGEDEDALLRGQGNVGRGGGHGSQAAVATVMVVRGDIAA